MLRDFSSEARQKLKDYVDEVTADGVWASFKDTFTDIPLIIKDWFGKLNISNYVDDAEAYYQDALDRNDTTKEKVDEIFDAVESLDTTFMGKLAQEDNSLVAMRKLVNLLANGIDPNGGNLDMSKLDGLLASAVETMNESIATKEKDIENYMLGTDPEGAATSVDPVNLCTGNFIYENEDLVINGEIPLAFHRYYNSKDVVVSYMGKGFRHNYEIYLQKREDGKFVVTNKDGQQTIYDEIENDDTIKIGNDCILQFNEHGKIRRIENYNQIGIDFIYDSKNRLETAKTDHGDFLKYEYDEKNRLTHVTDHTGRQVSLSYNAKNYLSDVVMPEGGSLHYEYAKNGRIQSVENASGKTIVTAEYDQKFRVLHQDFPDGSSMDFSYDDKKRAVTQTERNQNKSVFLHDEKYRNTEVLYEDGTKERFVYNDRNQKISSTDRNGNTTRMSYDNRGNLVQIIDAAKRRTNMTYDANGKLLSVSVNGRQRYRRFYDTKGNLIGQENLWGNTISFTNDEFGRPICAEYSDGSKKEIVYDTKGNIEKIINAVGGETKYQYDALNRVLATEDANGNITRFAYDKQNRIVKEINPEKNTKEYCYDEDGNLISCKDFDGYSIFMEYNEMGKMKTYTDKEGNRAEFFFDKMWLVNEIKVDGLSYFKCKYDKDGRMVEKTNRIGQTLKMERDAVGNKTAVMDEKGNRTEYFYTATNRVQKIRKPDGNEISFFYDKDGNLIQRTNEMGLSEVYTYDEFGRRTSKTNEANETVSVSYDFMSRPECIVYENGTHKKLEYGLNHQVSKVSYSSGNQMSYEYDKKGNLIRKINGNEEVTNITYDCMDRISSITNPVGGVRRYSYDAMGRVCVETDENGNETHYKYSPNGYLLETQDAKGASFKNEYNHLGQLISTNNNGQVTTYHRNEKGQITSIVDALGNEESYCYDACGFVKEKKDKDGFLTSFSYKENGLLNEILYGNGQTVKFSYNALNQLEEVKDWNGKLRFTLDPLGRILATEDSDGQTVRYERGLGGQRTAMIYPDGKRLDYIYNEMAQLVKLQSPEGVFQYAYDQMGRLESKSYPNGLISTYSYNELGRIASIEHKSETFYESFMYDYDMAGNKTRMTKNHSYDDSAKEVFDYQYDKLHQLTTVSHNGVLAREYAYDLSGNRIQKQSFEAGIEKSISYQYNDKNQLIQEIGSDYEKLFEYDARGNLTVEKQNQEIIKAYIYDATNKLKETTYQTENGRQNVSYQYNGLGFRTAANQCNYVLDLTKTYHNILQTKENDVKHDFYWDMENVVGMDHKFYLQDDVGSPIALFEGTKLEESYDYDEFGREKNQNFLERMQPISFAGYWMDESNSLYAQVRNYDATTGRFTSVDFYPGNQAYPKTVNPYHYCWNNPMSYVDRDGKFPDVLSGIANGWNDFIDDLEESVLGTDAVYGSEEVDGFSSEIKVHDGGNIWVNRVKSDDNAVGLGSEINLNITVPFCGIWNQQSGITLHNQFSIDSKDLSTLEYKNSLSIFFESGTYIESGYVVNKEGISKMIEEGGNIDTVPSELESEFGKVDDEEAVWSMRYVEHKMDWGEAAAALGVCLAVVAFAVLVADDTTVVGMADDGALLPLGTYIMTTSPSLKDTLFNFFVTCEKSMQQLLYYLQPAINQMQARPA